jgi:hypothetical protein
MPEFLISFLPAVPYAAVALGLIASLVLFVSVKREVHRSAHRERKRVEDLLRRLQEASAPPAASAAEPVYIPVALRPGFNINRRVHAMRMLRRGEDAAHIAAALGVSRREVELLVRVQQIVSKTVAAGSDRS